MNANFNHCSLSNTQLFYCLNSKTIHGFKITCTNWDDKMQCWRLHQAVFHLHMATVCSPHVYNIQQMNWNLDWRIITRHIGAHCTVIPVTVSRTKSLMQILFISQVCKSFVHTTFFSNNQKSMAYDNYNDKHQWKNRTPPFKIHLVNSLFRCNRKIAKSEY